MAAIDDILGKGGDSSTRKLLQVAPPPTGASLQGAPNSVSSQPSSQTSASQQPTSASPSTQPQAQQDPGTDATAVAGRSGTEQPHLSYAQMYEMLNPNKPETAEERAKREKREKSEAAIAAVGDTISALSNLWFTSQYAPNAYDPSKGMSATTKARWDKLRQEREARRREYADGYIRALAMDEAKNREDRNWRHTIEREKIADERYEVKAAQDKEQHDVNMDYYRSRADKEREDAAKSKVAAEMEADRITSIINKNNKSSLRGGRDGKKYVLHAPDGDHAYATASEYNAAVYRYAELYPDHVYTVYDRRVGDKTHQTALSTGGVAGQVESIPKGAKPKSANNGSKKPFDVSKYKRGGQDKQTPPPLN